MKMPVDHDTEHAARSFLGRVVRQYDVVGAILFGSRAHKHHRRDSDADVAVILHGHRGNFLDTKLALADIAYDVLLETGVLIQPLPIWEDEWQHPENSVNPALLQNINRDGVRL
jgi:predicted nucleotidyltransferase